MKTDILYGIHPVMEAIRAGKRTVYEIFFAPESASGQFRQLRKRAETLGVPVTEQSKSEIRSLSGTAGHQGVAARVSDYSFSNLADLIHPPDPLKLSPFILLLDGILDPHNLGAIARTALCAGVDGIVIPKDRSAGPTPVTSKVSAGAVEHLPLVRVTNLVRAIGELKQEGFWVLGLEQKTQTHLYQSDLTGPIVLVIGGEGKGIRRLVKKSCDRLIAIPQAGPVDSLNASVAGAVAIYEAVRQRRGYPKSQAASAS